jgi:hypothetical protein
MQAGLSLSIPGVAALQSRTPSGPPPAIEDGTQLDFSNALNSGHVVTAGM